MKILCDVCGRNEAAVFGSADDAALCAACDCRNHRANKLAVKHSRFSHHSLAATSHPFCDICQERRGFVFCQEDRAILCSECDSPIHAANHLTMKHNRFILAGIRLSAAISSDSQEISNAEITAPTAAGGGAGSNGSSISEYLIKMLPGYCVEDLLLEDSMNVAQGFNEELETAEGFPLWVPHVPQVPPPPLLSTARVGAGERWQGLEKKDVSEGYHVLASDVERWKEDMFAVPQILAIAPSTGNKRQRDSANLY